jgi:hypothetical protein
MIDDTSWGPDPYIGFEDYSPVKPLDSVDYSDQFLEPADDRDRLLEVQKDRAFYNQAFLSRLVGALSLRSDALPSRALLTTIERVPVGVAESTPTCRFFCHPFTFDFYRTDCTWYFVIVD